MIASSSMAGPGLPSKSDVVSDLTFDAFEGVHANALTQLALVSRFSGKLHLLRNSRVVADYPSDPFVVIGPSVIPLSKG
jgi:hypothetical protein